MKSLVTLTFFAFFAGLSSSEDKEESSCFFFLLSFCLDCRLRDGTEVDFFAREMTLRQKTNLWATMPQAEQVHSLGSQMGELI